MKVLMDKGASIEAAVAKFYNSQPYPEVVATESNTKLILEALGY